MKNLNILMLCSTLVFGYSYSMQQDNVSGLSRNSKVVDCSDVSEYSGLTDVEDSYEAYSSGSQLINENSDSKSLSVAGKYEPDKNLVISADTRCSHPVINYQEALLHEIKEAMEKEKVARIVSFDGGGIRGIIPAQWSAELEYRTDKPMSELFHMMAGTSTGGILAAGLSTENPNDVGTPLYSANELVSIYDTEGSKIFKKRSFWDNPFGLFKSKYQTTSAYNVYTSYFGDQKLTDTLNDVLITYYDMTNRRSRFFKSHKAKNDSHGYDYYLRDVVASTTAAPTYFRSFPLQTVSEQQQNSHTFIKAIDGGVFANDPSGCALTEAYTIYPNADAYFLLSMGTGYCNSKHSEPVSLISWAKAISGILMGNASDVTQYTIRKQGLISNKKIFYARAQVALSAKHTSMDNASRDNVGYLMQLAKHGTKDGLSSSMSELKKIRSLAPVLSIEKTDRNALIQDAELENIEDVGNFLEVLH